MLYDKNAVVFVAGEGRFESCQDLFKNKFASLFRILYEGWWLLVSQQKKLQIIVIPLL